MLRFLCRATFNFPYFFFCSNLIKVVQIAVKFLLLFALLMKMGNWDQWPHSFPGAAY